MAEWVWKKIDLERSYHGPSLHQPQGPGHFCPFRTPSISSRHLPSSPTSTAFPSLVVQRDSNCAVVTFSTRPLHPVSWSYGTWVLSFFPYLKRVTRSSLQESHLGRLWSALRISVAQPYYSGGMSFTLYSFRQRFLLKLYTVLAY